MRSVLLLLVTLTCMLGGCDVGSIQHLKEGAPAGVFTSVEPPQQTLSGLALATDGSGGRVEYIDTEAKRLVISSKHPMTGERLALMVIEAEPKEGGSTVTIWATPKTSVFGGDWAAKVWEAYTKHCSVTEISSRGTQ